MKKIQCSVIAVPPAISAMLSAPCFQLECEAVKRVREQMGLKNLEIMIPFVRTLTEAKAVQEVLEGKWTRTRR